MEENVKAKAEELSWDSVAKKQWKSIKRSVLVITKDLSPDYSIDRVKILKK